MKTNIDELTIREAKELAALFANNMDAPEKHPWVVGAKYCIRTVTMVITGELIAVYPAELLMGKAAWIADTGRYADFLRDPVKIATEVEPYPEEALVPVGRNSLIDACPIPALPCEQR